MVHFSWGLISVLLSGALVVVFESIFIRLRRSFQIRTSSLMQSESVLLQLVDSELQETPRSSNAAVGVSLPSAAAASLKRLCD